MQLDLNDLRPVEAEFRLSNDRVYRLKKMSLDVNIWLTRKFKPDELSDIFLKQKLPEMSRIAYYMLKDKTDFPSLKSFREAVVTLGDKVALVQAIIESVGISKPLMKKLSAEEVKSQGNA